MRLHTSTLEADVVGVRRVPTEIMVDPLEIAAFCDGRVWIKGSHSIDVSESASQIAQQATEIFQLLDLGNDPDVMRVREMASAVLDG